MKSENIRFLLEIKENKELFLLEFFEEQQTPVWLQICFTGFLKSSEGTENRSRLREKLLNYLLQS